MKKYKVVIPPPKAKRMNSEKHLYVEYSDGWGGVDYLHLTIPPDGFSAEFQLPEDYEYQYNTSKIDGMTFDVYVEYHNKSGSRIEKKHLVPELVNEPARV